METFVLRVWVPEDDGAEASPPGLRGVLEHVKSGRSVPFRDPAHLAALLLGMTGSVEATPASTEPVRPGTRRSGVDPVEGPG